VSEVVATNATPAVPAAPPAPAPAAASDSVAQKPADSATAPQGDGKAPATPDAAQKPGQSRFERRIARLTREAAEARAERDLLRRQLDEAKPKAAEDPAAPRLEQFKDIEEYAEAKAKYRTDQALKERDTKARTETQRQAQTRLAAQWEDKIERAADKYDDFEDVVGNLKPGVPWVDAIMEAENGEDIAYFLGKNEKEARRIIGLAPLSQIREIGRLEAKLLADPPVKPKKPSAAPEPIKPLSGNAPPPGGDSPQSSDDFPTWMKKRLKQGPR
jgi:hypothetical protein